MIGKTSFLLVAISIIALSALYNFEYYDQELFFMHQLPEGTLSLKNKELEFKSNQLTSFTNQTGFYVYFNQKPIFFSKRTNNSSYAKSFILIAKEASAEIDSHGDSFFKVNNKIQSFCSEQEISKMEETQEGLKIIGKFADCQESQYQVQLKCVSQSKLNLVFEFESKKVRRALVRFVDGEKSQYYGLGEQFSHLILGKNRPYSMFVREKGVGRGDQPETSLINYLHKASGTYYSTYCPMPIWYSSQNIAYMLAPLNQSDSHYSYTAWMNNQLFVWLIEDHFQISVIVSQSQTPKQIIREVAQINGFTKKVPNWVNEGAIIGLQGGTEVVLEKYRLLKESGAKIKGLWLQDWVSKRYSKGYSRLWWNWQLDEDHYPNWHQMREQLKKENVDILIYLNPMFTDPSQKKHKSNFHKQFQDKNYFIKLNSGENFQTSAFSDFRASLVDFENSQAKKYYQNLLRRVIDETGVRGMMIDFGEAYPINGKYSGVEEAMIHHNKYPVIYHQAARQVLDQFENKELYTFTRAGFAGAPRFAQSLWAGDQNMNFKYNTGIRSCLIAMLSSGLGGYSSTHCDIGGYTHFMGISDRTQKLMTRWMQLAAFSPVFRTHEGNAPEQTLQVFSNQNIRKEFSFYSEIFAALSEYRKKEWQKCENYKLPLIRPLFVQLGFSNSKVSSIDDQFYLGEDILVSPIITASDKRKFYLPEGTWIDLWTNAQIRVGAEGKQQEYKGYLLPAFIKISNPLQQKILNSIKQILKKYKSVLQRYELGYSQAFQLDL